MKNKKLPAEALGFTEYLQKKDLTKTTQNSYLKDVNRFLQWFSNEPTNCTKKDILNYLAYLKNIKNQSSTTRNCYLNSLKNYFAYLLSNDLIAKNPTNFIKIRGVKRKFLYHIFKLEELVQLADDYYQNFIRNYDDSKTPENRKINSKLSRERNYIILQLLLNQGLVTSEIARITLQDIDLNKATISIKGTKKSNTRTLQLQASQIGPVINYLHKIRPQFLEHYKQETEQLFLLFPEKAGTLRNISYNYNNLFLKLTKQLKTLQPDFLNFKQIRASVITNWIKDKGLRNAQYLAGHRYISSTENYKINDLESLTEDIAKHHPF